MMTEVMLALALAAAAATTDQTVEVKKGARLEVRNYAGDIVVKVWGRDAVRVEAEHSERESVEVRPGDLAVVVRTRANSGRPRSVDLVLTVPSWMAIDIDSTYADVRLDGVGGTVDVETRRGDIVIRGGTGFIAAKSLQGAVSVEQAKGRVQIETSSDDVRVVDVSGDISVASTNGDIALARVDTGNLDVYTVNGGIAYDAPLKANGAYRLTTHNGLVQLTLPENTNATLSVRTYGGSFRSTFPVTLDDQNRRNRFTLKLGDGSARVELESFNGSIALRRPGDPEPERRSRSGRQNPAARPAPPAPPAPAAPPAPPAPPARPPR